LLPEARVVRLDPSETITLVKVSAEETTLAVASPLDWVELIDPKRVDYDYDPHLVPPPTAEVAKHFPALSAEETKFVLDYCHSGIVAKSRSMEPPEDVYWRRPRLWKLEIYDHTGRATAFDYRIEGSELEVVSIDAENIDWKTEVSIFKLFSALKAGESLSSMYVRIEGEPGVDVVEDPLVRCLFTGEFGSYQIAQLEKLRQTASAQGSSQGSS
jgi:hypothetical protein